MRERLLSLRIKIYFYPLQQRCFPMLNAFQGLSIHNSNPEAHTEAFLYRLKLRTELSDPYSGVLLFLSLLDYLTFSPQYLLFMRLLLLSPPFQIQAIYLVIFDHSYLFTRIDYLFDNRE